MNDSPPAPPRRRRIGALLVPTGSPHRLIDRAVEVEGLGFDLVTIDDHLVNPHQPEAPWLEAWTTLAAIAQATSSIRVGTLVSNVILRHPAMLARQAHTVDQISAGRLEVGLGAGYAPTDHDAVESPRWSPTERSDRFAEAVAFVDAALRGAPTAPGEHYAPAPLVLAPPSSQQPRPPLVVAADGPRALDVAAAHADTWVTFGGWGLTTDGVLDLVRRRGAILDERCVAHGRHPSEVERMLLAGSAAVNSDPVWTSVERFVDFVGRCGEAGIDSFTFYWPPKMVSADVNRDVVAEVVDKVLPGLRSD